MIYRYGVKHSSMSPKLLEKIKATFIKKYRYNYDDSNFHLYKTLTRKNKSILFNTWDGIDSKVIASIDNLCYTKRFLNSKKGLKNFDIFIELLSTI